MVALDVVVGRQPIFERDLSVFGYELLFRPINAGSPAEAAGERGDQMTADVLFGSVSIGIHRLVGGKKLFCNASRGVLTGAVPVLLPPEQTVVEILEGIEPDDEVLAGCRRLRSEGFTLALDDVSSFSAAEPFLPLASIVKIDLRATDPSHLAPLVKRCRRADLAIVAEKVETIDEFRWCETLGFDYFQGYFLARPSPVPGRALDPGRVAQLRLVGRLLDHECDLAELEGIFRVDPAMTLQLLQLAGMGADRGMRRTVQTVREALVLAGWRRLQSWVALLLIGGKGQASEEELTTALTRARACELVAEAVGGALTETAFTAGMVSSFDILLGVPLEDVLRELPLDDDVRRALLEEEGSLGRLVADVTDFLLGRPEQATRSGLPDELLSPSALSALMWAVEVTATLAVPEAH